MLVIRVNPCKSQKADWENGIEVTSSALLCTCSFGSPSTPHGGGNSPRGFLPNTNKREEEEEGAGMSADSVPAQTSENANGG